MVLQWDGEAGEVVLVDVIVPLGGDLDTGPVKKDEDVIGPSGGPWM